MELVYVIGSSICSGMEFFYMLFILLFVSEQKIHILFVLQTFWNGTFTSFSFRYYSETEI